MTKEVKNLTAFKSEIKPTEEQKREINKTMGICRVAYNQYLWNCKERRARGEKNMSEYDFVKYFNGDFIKENPGFEFVKNCSSIARNKAIGDAAEAYKRFFKKQSGFPKFKKKGSDVGVYFKRGNKTKDLSKWTVPCERHRIKLPKIGWVRLKRKGYIPTDLPIVSGRITRKADRYFVSVLVEYPENAILKENKNEPLGVDLGIKEFAIASSGDFYRNINKDKKIKKIEKKLKREQRALSRKQEMYKKNPNIGNRKNYLKNKLRIQKLHMRLDNIRGYYRAMVIDDLAKKEPKYISIEDLKVSGMLKNRHLSKSISEQCFHDFKIRLTNRCKKDNIELRLIDRWYPSSQLCHCCGNKDVKMKNIGIRTYKCELCGYVEDRDLNAAYNIRDCKKYVLAY